MACPSGMYIYGSPFSLVSPLSSSSQPILMDCTLFYHLFIHPNTPPIVSSMHPISNPSLSPCDQMCHSHFIYSSPSRWPRSIFISQTPSLIPNLPIGKTPYLSGPGFCLGRGFPPFATHQMTHHVTVTTCCHCTDFITVQSFIIVLLSIVLPLSMATLVFVIGPAPITVVFINLALPWGCLFNLKS